MIDAYFLLLCLTAQLTLPQFYHNIKLSICPASEYKKRHPKMSRMSKGYKEIYLH